MKELITHDNPEYTVRARRVGPRARDMAVTYVRETNPELYQEFVRRAYEEYELEPPRKRSRGIPVKPLREAIQDLLQKEQKQ